MSEEVSETVESDPDDDGVACEYIATAEEPSVGHTDNEIIMGNVVYCTAKATRVIRPAGDDISLNPHMPRQKRAVCNAHGGYLVGASPGDRPNNGRHWEFDAMDPEQVVETDEETTPMEGDDAES